jgi:hypothetical protein
LVGSINAYDYVNKKYEAIKNDPRIASLGCEEVLHNAKSSYEVLCDTIGKVFGWTSSQWELERKNAEEVMIAFDKSFGCLSDYLDSIKRITQKVSKESQGTKRKLRDLKTDIKEFLTEGAAPDTFATVLANILHARVGDHWFEPFHGQSEGGSSGAYPYEYKDGASFEKPLSFIIKDADDYYSKALATAATNLRVKAMAQTEAAIKFFGREKNANASHVSSCIPFPNLDFNNPDAEETKFSLAGDFQPVVYVQRSWAFPDALEANPLAGNGGFISVMSGYACVYVFEISHMIEFSLGIETLSQYVERLDPTFFARVPSFGMTRGNSLWVPPGSVAVVIGLSAMNNKNEDYDFLTYLFYPCLDTTAVKKLSYAVRTEIAALVSKGHSRGLKLHTGSNWDTMKVFLELLKVVPIASADAD